MSTIKKLIGALCMLPVLAIFGWGIWQIILILWSLKIIQILLGATVLTILFILGLMLLTDEL